MGALKACPGVEPPVLAVACSSNSGPGWQDQSFPGLGSLGKV